MKLVIAFLALTTATPSVAGTPLDGAWTVDLSVKPNEPYAKPMVLTLKSDGVVTGMFYQSEIEAGRWKTDRGRTCVVFRTTDGVGPYHTSACLVGDQMQGQTWAEKRNFVFVWNAARAATVTK
jgi:hypothetical protein